MNMLVKDSGSAHVSPLRQEITKFCGLAYDTEWTRNPNRASGYLYATNRHIAVRVPDDPTIAAGSLAPKAILELFENFDQDAFTWHDIPAIDDVLKCRACEGSGFVNPCPDCDGQGDFEHGHHTYQCAHCNGLGCNVAHATDKDRETCDCCFGTGIDPYDGQDIDGARYAKRYLYLISKTFPEAQIGVPADQETAAMWRCGDVVGALMPLRK